MKPTCQTGLRLKSGFVLHVHKVCSTWLLPVASGPASLFQKAHGLTCPCTTPRAGGMAVCSRGRQSLSWGPQASPEPGNQCPWLTGPLLSRDRVAMALLCGQSFPVISMSRKKLMLVLLPFSEGFIPIL